MLRVLLVLLSEQLVVYYAFIILEQDIRTALDLTDISNSYATKIKTPGTEYCNIANYTSKP